ncbi:MAG: hypothetical protein C0599_09740 [Salinivirgaceae bacterium]|nr:MAG: hypothetical protein C0599_09740 [Salinivirgaceae bacterium]
MRVIIFLVIFLISHCSYSQTDYQKFSKSELLEDFHELYKSAIQIHPKLASKEFLNEFTRLYELQKDRIEDSLNLNEFYLIAAPLLASLNDAHTNVIIPNKPRIQYMLHNNGLSFPFDISIRSDSIFLKYYFGNEIFNYNESESVQSINGIANSELLKQMRSLTGAKKRSIQNRTIERYFRSYLWMIWGFEDDYDLVFQDDSKLNISGVDNDTFLQNRIPKDLANYSLKVDSLQKIAFLKIKSFAHLESFVPFVDSAFLAIQKTNCNKLVIDVRENMGGRSIVVDSLMNFLTQQTYAQYKSIKLRVSEPLKAYYAKRPYKLKSINYPNDTIIAVSGKEIQPHYKSSKFKGGLYVWVSARTFSAASTFAGLIKHLGIGKIVGEETGGTIGYYGDFWFQKLPNTQMTYYISPKEFVQFGGDDLDKGVSVDFSEINYNVLD